MTTFKEGNEVQPTELVTLKVYVPGSNPVMVRDVPLAVISISSGYLVRVHVPVGNPLMTTLPVATVYVGCVIVPTVGAVGVAGWALITTFSDNEETHPPSFSTEKLYVPVVREETVIVVPVPCVVLPPGYCLRIQFPKEGNPLSTTLPVASAQVG